MLELEKRIFKSVNYGILIISVLLVILLLSNTASAANETILVATNRYVILDDPNTGTPDTGSGFVNPASSWNSNIWAGKNTIINATALYIGANGKPVSGINITFTLYRYNGQVNTATRTTDSYGLANYSYDLNGSNYYGRWRVSATNGSLAANTTFIYNWWGCSFSFSPCSGHPTQSSLTANSIANSPYYSGRDRTTGRNSNHYAVATNCTWCHQSYDGTPGGQSGTINHSNYASDVHRNILCTNINCHGDYYVHGRSTSSGNMLIASCYNVSGGCHINRFGQYDISNKSTLGNSTNIQYALSLYSYNNGSNLSYYFNATFHSPNSTVPCIICHGPMHNISKPNASTPRNPDTENEQCTTCHKSYSKHNNSVNCTFCHSDDVHYIQVFSQNGKFVNHSDANQGNCTNCHQNASFMNALKWNQTANPKGSNYTGRNPVQIPSPMNHSINTYSGAMWNGSQNSYWDSKSQGTACIYCHGSINTSLHNASALGDISKVKGANNLNQSFTNGYWCANCHYKNAAGYKGNLFYPQPPEVLNQNGLVPPTANDGTSFLNHSSDLSSVYDDAKCKSCHNNNLAAGATSLNFSHNAGTGQSGGPDCISCHDMGGSAGTGKLVNFTAMNSTEAIHKNLNSGAVTALSAQNKKCWACHGGGSEPPAGNHPAGYTTPKACAYCHNNASTTYGAFQVMQHYWNGASIDTAIPASCYDCHNKSEMMLGNYDPDGPAGVYGGVNGGNNSTSHYGRKRTDYPAQGTNDYCNKCHNNQSTVFPFIDNDNRTIANHSTAYQSTNPDCADCHATGRIHNGTLTKPVLSLNNSAYCLPCHGTPGGINATIKNLEQHNGSAGLNCTQCHLNSTRSIHPVRYLQQDGINWSQTKTNAVNCTTCHQTGLVNFSKAAKIPKPMNHSTDPYSGALWSGTQSGYWTNTSQQSGCDYCHGKIALHNSSGLGNITKVKGTNIKSQGLDTGRWCVNCHYKNAPEYAGTSFSPEPPEILNASGKLPSKARDGTNFENHSGYVISGYNDSMCKDCHAVVGSYGSTSLNYSHSLDTGVAGGPNCTQCHDIGGSATGKLVNFSAMNDTGAIHKNLNSNANTGGLPAENKKCWACHGNGSNPVSGHPAGYKTPSRCIDCHVARQNLNYTPNSMLLNVTEHYWNGTDIDPSNATSCYSCHNKSEMMLQANDPDSGSGAVYGGANGGNNSSSHYGRKRTDYPTQDTNDYCNKCHNNQSTVFPFIDNNNKTIANHSINYPATNPVCKDCHGIGRIHNSTLQKPTMTLQNSSYCLGCHGTGGNATIKNLEQHNGSEGLNCRQCHLNSTRSIHPVQYLQKDNTWNTSITNVVNCTDCHQGQGMQNFSKAPIIPDTLKHSSNISNGSIWNAYWATEEGSCYYCHNDTIHNATALGKISNILAPSDTNNIRNGLITTTTWCADCHYNIGNTNYMGSQWNPVPPLITINNTGKSIWVNHSGYLTGGYQDGECESCHTLNGTSYQSTSLNYSHSLGEGVSGGPNCTKCHDIGGLAGPNITVNFTAASQSGAIHKNLNAAVSTFLPAENKKCWACHGNGNQPPGGHPADYLNPKQCKNCHMNGEFNAPVIKQHYPGSVFLGTLKHSMNYTSGSCQVCHNASVIFNNISANLNATISHYAGNKSNLKKTNTSTSCSDCHNGSTIYGVPEQLPSAESHSYGTNTCQVFCHNANYINATLVNAANLHNASIGIYYNCYGEGCHPPNMR